MKVITKEEAIAFLKMMKTQGCFTLDHAIEKIDKRLKDNDDVVYRMWKKGENNNEIQKNNS